MQRKMFLWDGRSETPSSEYNFHVGVGKVDITPTEDPLPALMGGATALPAESVSVPLYVKAVVIVAGKQKIAMVTLDILKYPSVQTDLAAQQIETETGIPAGNVTITASHTHSGPLYLYYLDALYGKDRLVTAIVEAVKQADNDLAPCKIGISDIRVAGVSHNRRLLIEGEAWNDWLVKPPIDKRALPVAGPIDPELQVLAAVGQDGKYKAILWNYASHPNANRTPTISADFPGYVQQYADEKLGYETTTLFFPGASADINPDHAPEVIGQTITDKLIQSLGSIRFIRKPAISVDRRTLQIPGREHPVFAEEEISAKWPGMLESYRESFRTTLLSARETYAANLTGIRIGDEFAIITNPSELFAAIGLDIKSNSPFEQIMVVQQTNGALGYIPAASDFELKGYEVWYGEHSNLSVTAGETIRNESLDMLNHLQTN